MKNTMKNLLLAWALTFSSASALANDTNDITQEVNVKTDEVMNFDKSITVWQKNMFKTNAGFTPVDNSVTEISTSVKSWKVDFFAWLAHNNKTNKVNEIDLWVWYSDKIWDIDYRAGFEKWYFKENWWDTQLATLWLNYKNIWLLYKKFLDWKNWDILSLSMSENFKVWKILDYDLNLNTEARTTFVKNVFWKNWHTNDKYTASLSWTNWYTSITWFISQHDWHNWQKDVTQVWVNMSYKF